MRILSAIQSPEAIRAILDHLGLPSRAPPITAARSWENSAEDAAPDTLPEDPVPA